MQVETESLRRHITATMLTVELHEWGTRRIQLFEDNLVALFFLGRLLIIAIHVFIILWFLVKVSANTEARLFIFTLFKTVARMTILTRQLILRR